MEILKKQNEFQDEHMDSQSIQEDEDSVCEGLSVVSSSKQHVDTERCIRKSSFSTQRCKGLTVIHLDEDMREHCDGFVNLVTPYGLGIIYTAGSPFSVPVRTRTSKYLNGSLHVLDKKRRANSYSDLFIQYASVHKPQKIITSPGEKWISDSWNDKAANLLNGPLLIHMGDEDGSTSSESASSVDMRETNFSESPGPPSVIYSGSSWKPTEEVHHRKWRSESNVSDQMFVSFTSSRSISFYHSKSSRHVPHSKGLLHCIWKNGIPYFEFLMAEDQDEVYLASPCKGKIPHGSKAPDYMYMFQTRRSCEKGGHHANIASRVVGKMKVSSCITFNSNGCSLVESEFVLNGASEHNQRHTPNSTCHSLKSKGLSKSVVSIFKTHNLNQKKIKPRTGEMNMDLENLFQEPCVDDMNHMQPSLELAAIVIRHPQCYSDKRTTVGGWGLKFIEKIGHVDVNASLDSSAVENCHRFEKQPVRSVNVVVPAGLHGATRSGGPSSLLERWRTKGLCDCGGWDVGCPLTIFNNQEIHDKAFSRETQQKDCSAVLFKEGARQGEAALRMVNLQEGLYAVYFHANLSALQSFSVGVALIHTQTPDLCPKL